MEKLNSTLKPLIVAAFVTAACGGSSGPTGPSGPPVVNLVNGATLPSGTIGTTVVIQGSNFGTSQASAAGHVLFSTTAGGRDTASISSTSDWTNTLIVTTVPTGVPQGTDTLFVKTSGGTSTPVVFTVLKAVTFNPSTISWTSTTALPAGLSGHAIAAATLPGAALTSVVYVVGGGKDSTNAPRDSVLYATVSNTGTVGAWTRTAVLPAPVAFAAALVATPANSPVAGNSYLYVIGGDSTASGKPVATVYAGTLSATGAVTSWSTTTALPSPLHSVGAAIFNGNVYVAGGSGSGNAPVATVYRAAIQSNGGLGAWQALTALPFARSYFGFGVNGTFLYAFGGDSAAVSPNDSSVKGSTVSDVVYAQIDVHTGNLTGGWIANANKLKKAVSKHTAVVAAGNVLITAGLYTGATTGATEETYAALNADGSTSAFNGATGSNTISSAGGGNLFNHAATGYLDGTGAFHVLVVGGDDVNTPTTSKHSGLFYH